MIETAEQRRFFRNAFVINPVVINFLLNGLIGWLIFGSQEAIPLWGAQSLAVDMLLTYFLIPFLTALIITPLVRRLVKQGDLAAVPWTRDRKWWLAWLPDGKWRRALVMGMAAAVFGSIIVVGLLTLLGLTAVSSTEAILLKAAASALLAALVTPLLALGALADASQERLQQVGQLIPAIPIAQLPPGHKTSHVPDHNFQPVYSFNTRPKNGLPMIVHRRSDSPIS